MPRPPVPISTVLRELKKLYRPPKSFLHWKTPLDLLIATVLSAQCTDARVNHVTMALFRKFREPADYLRVPIGDLERAIRSCGTYRNKARYIQGLCRIIIENHGGAVPRMMNELTALPGVGRKTASIVLFAAFGKRESIAVDTHVLRLSRRLGLSTAKDPQRVETDLLRIVPQTEWGSINTLLISHGRAVCTARNRKCDQCVFAAICPSSRVQGYADLAADTRKSAGKLGKTIGMAPVASS